MTPPPPRSTLFPYTTLFRSILDPSNDPTHWEVLKDWTTFPELVWLKDRKSTRLNSSHLVTSYAVFCLKKKKKLGGAYRLVEQSNSQPSVANCTAFVSKEALD